MALHAGQATGEPVSVRCGGAHAGKGDARLPRVDGRSVRKGRSFEEGGKVEVESEGQAALALGRRVARAEEEARKVSPPVGFLCLTPNRLIKLGLQSLGFVGMGLCWLTGREEERAPPPARPPTSRRRGGIDRPHLRRSLERSACQGGCIHGRDARERDQAPGMTTLRRACQRNKQKQPSHDRRQCDAHLCFIPRCLTSARQC